MKKIKLLLIFSLIAGLMHCTSQALWITEYGAPLVVDSFENVSINEFPYDSTSATVLCTDTDAYKGDVSVLLDASAVNDGEEASFSRSFFGYGVDPTKENYGVCFYVKGEKLDKNDLKFVYTYYNKNGAKNGIYKDLEMQEAENGWIKITAVLPRTKDFILTQSGRVGVSFVKQSEKTNCIYIDEMSVYSVPDNVEFKNCNVTSLGNFCLDDMEGIAYSPDGTAENIANMNLVDWQVVSGNAEIKDRVLHYNDDEKKIVIKGEFFGCTDTATLWISDNVKELPGKAMLTPDEILDNDGVYSVKITNSGDASGTASIIATVYENGRLCDIAVSSATIEPNSQVTLSTDKITGSDVRVTVWDSIFGCISIKN